MNKKYLLLLAAALTAMPVAQSQAQSRYSKPPATVLSPDLTTPWVLQLKRPPVNGQRAQVRLAEPKPKRTTRGLFGIKRNSNRPATGIFASRTTQSRNVNRTLRRTNAGIVHGQPRTQRRVQTASATQAMVNHPANRKIDPKFYPQTVNFETNQPVGTILIDTNTRFLYLVQGNGKARRYGVGVGKEGFDWRGTETVTRKAEWPSWTPPKEMIARERKKGRELPNFMPGGPENPMGARAIYLGSTLYRIHGTNQPWTIGQAVSSGCIRMRNEDVMDLYERVKHGAKVVVS